jgi:hypothetical protein
MFIQFTDKGIYIPKDPFGECHLFRIEKPNIRCCGVNLIFIRYNRGPIKNSGGAKRSEQGGGTQFTLI